MVNLRTFICMDLFQRMMKIRALKSSRAASKGPRDGREKSAIAARAGKGPQGRLGRQAKFEPSCQRSDRPTHLCSFSFFFQIEQKMQQVHVDKLELKTGERQQLSRSVRCLLSGRHCRHPHPHLLSCPSLLRPREREEN